MSRVAIKAVEDRAQLGIVMMLVAYLSFSFIDTSVKWLVIAGLPALQLAFVRYAGHFLISIGTIARGGIGPERFATEHPWTVLLRGALLVSSTAFNFISLNYLPLTVTSAIMFSAPIIVCALSMPLLGERVGPWRWLAIVVGFAGVLVVIRPGGAAFHWAMLLSIYNAFALALYSILTRKLAGVVATETLQLYGSALGTITLLPFAWAVWQNPVGAVDWFIMFALGLWGWGGHELLTRAHAFAPASTLMPYTYSFMIYLTISSYLIFDHVPDQATVLGALIIIASGLLIWARERRA
ncbi:DMT family transporter [Litoreibacter roseus]|uniref:EamA domain-containing protein n=1 Tax=Litoreibacter roseus TaxID=2601869 RepID=A0A6N6JJ80_9RHOB|nr:DMT family transporter [Litoreibacter roseus]GFE65479.1 hypothetical protein KIN_25530 [Litoreibacter roseus]